MKTILIVGNYGINGKLNGQTARTRTVTETISKIYRTYKIETINSNNLNIRVLFKFLCLCIKADKIIIMPAKGSIHTLFYILNVLNLLKKTNYIVIGGWLYEFLLENPNLIKKIKKLNSVLVQTNGLKSKLLLIDINSTVLHNYRIYKDLKRNNNKKNNKYVFYSRIREDKGILIAIDVINKLNKMGIHTYLDIYGPIDENFKTIFYEKIKNNDNIKYCGILNGNETIIETLSKYKALLFPTYYDGEGFPGALLESMVAGLPVIASNWKYNAEIIKNNIDGFIFNNSIIELIKIIKSIENNEVKLDIIRKNWKKKSQKYNENNAIKIIETAIGK